MTKRLFTVLISLAIAFQSVMSLADVDQQHYSEAQHHEYLHDVAELEKLTLQALKQRGIPAVVLGGGGYSRDSYKSVAGAVLACVELVD